MYLSGAVTDELLELHHPQIGLMTQPGSYGMKTVDKWPAFAADNGGFGDKFDPVVWLPWLDKIAARGDRCLFAVVPDRFDPNDLAGNHAATMERWHQYKTEVVERGLPPAFVAQNGCTPDDVPIDATCVFIGGDTTWKLSEKAWAIVAAAKAHGSWVHIGRVNGLPRFRAGAISGADSADGNVLRYGRDANLPRLLTWLRWTSTQQSLPLFGAA